MPFHIEDEVCSACAAQASMMVGSMRKTTLGALSSPRDSLGAHQRMCQNTPNQMIQTMECSLR